MLYTKKIPAAGVQGHSGGGYAGHHLRCGDARPSYQTFGRGFALRSLGLGICGGSLGGGIGKRLIVRFDHCLFQHTPELGIDGVDDIPEGLIGVFPAGHDDKELIACIDDLDIVDSELSVKRHRHDGLHGTILKQLSYFDVRDLHNMAPPLL